MSASYEQAALAAFDNGSCKHGEEETCYYCAPAASPAQLGRW